MPISSPLFAPKLLAVQALLLHAVLWVPPDMLWPTIIGLNILADYGLYAPTTHLHVFLRRGGAGEPDHKLEPGARR